MACTHSENYTLQEYGDRYVAIFGGADACSERLAKVTIERLREMAARCGVRVSDCTFRISRVIPAIDVRTLPAAPPTPKFEVRVDFTASQSSAQNFFEFGTLCFSAMVGR